MIASLAREELNTQKVVAALGGQLGLPGRQLPHSVTTASGEMQPINFFIYWSNVLMVVALLASGIP